MEPGNLKEHLLRLFNNPTWNIIDASMEIICVIVWSAKTSEKMVQRTAICGGAKFPYCLRMSSTTAYSSQWNHTS